MVDLLSAMLVGHFFGDYLLQNDYIAISKTRNPTMTRKELVRSFLICALHCSLYTFAVWACSFGRVSAPMLLFCFSTHMLIDHFGVARRFMSIAGQEGFATGVFSPWSIVVVDNTMHIMCLLVIAYIQLGA